MASSKYLFVETDGIKLTDGTVFGAGISLKYQITDGAIGDYMDTFHIFYFSGNDRIRQCDPMRYKEMREWVHDQVKHYNSCGMKLWEADHSEWDKAKYKKLVTLDW